MSPPLPHDVRPLPPAARRPRRRRARLAAGTQPVPLIDADRVDGEWTPPDLRLASALQRQLLPPVPADLAGVPIATAYRPAHHIGGDFYDLVATGDGRVMAVMADVSGKGMAAALVMARVAMDVRRALVGSASPSDALAYVNRTLAARVPDDMFITAICLEVDLRRRRARAANAGHVPLFVRSADGTARTVAAASGAPLGVLRDETYAVESVDLRARDILVLMTDGVTDALDPSGDPAAGATATVVSRAAPDVHAVVAALVAAVDRRTAGGRPDDVAVLALEIP